MQSVMRWSAVVLIALAVPTSAQATVVTWTNRAAFESQGVVVENYGYEDFPSGGFSFPGDPWTAHGVTYTTGANIIVGSGTGYQPVSNVFTYDGWTPVTGNIASGPQYTMFGVDLAYIGFSSPITFTAFTNLGSSTFSALLVPNASAGQDFYGFTASGGEYFTGFQLSSAGGNGSAPVIDNVTLGDAGAPIPEPATVALLGAGLVGLAARRRRVR